jgi:hypothetical protein
MTEAASSLSIITSMTVVVDLLRFHLRGRKALSVLRSVLDPSSSPGEVYFRRVAHGQGVEGVWPEGCQLGLLTKDFRELSFRNNTLGVALSVDSGTACTSGPIIGKKRRKRKVRDGWRQVYGESPLWSSISRTDAVQARKTDSAVNAARHAVRQIQNDVCALTTSVATAPPVRPVPVLLIRKQAPQLISTNSPSSVRTSWYLIAPIGYGANILRALGNNSHHAYTLHSLLLIEIPCSVRGGSYCWVKGIRELKYVPGEPGVGPRKITLLTPVCM